MRAKIIMFILISIVIASNSKGQYANFITTGRIDFKREVNTFGAMSIFLKETQQVPIDQIGVFMQNYRINSPQFWTDDFELFFYENKSFYQPKNPNIEFSKSFRIPIAYKNKVFSDYDSEKVVVEKQVYENSILINDSIKKTRWKLTNETREIAGFLCRRANAVIQDSVYIVAFYTEEIPIKAGPEAFNGLPGMILGIAIPHQHITYFATNVTEISTNVKNWSIPKVTSNSKLSTYAEFKKLCKDMLKRVNISSEWVNTFSDL